MKVSHPSLLFVLLAGLAVEAIAHHSFAMFDRTVEKVYHALVQGHPDPLSGTIDDRVDQLTSETEVAPEEGGDRVFAAHVQAAERARRAARKAVKEADGARRAARQEAQEAERAAKRLVREA